MSTFFPSSLFFSASNHGKNSANLLWKEHRTGSTTLAYSASARGVVGSDPPECHVQYVHRKKKKKKKKKKKTTRRKQEEDNKKVVRTNRWHDGAIKLADRRFPRFSNINHHRVLIPRFECSSKLLWTHVALSGDGWGQSG
jgi:hypothetical protein